MKAYRITEDQWNDVKNTMQKLVDKINDLESEESISFKESETVASFIDYCKEEGLEISGKYFEGFFNA